MHIFFISNSIFGLTLGFCRKFTFSRLKVASGLLSNFQNFNCKKFFQNTGSLKLVYIFRMQRTPFTGRDSDFHLKFAVTS